MAPLTRQEAFRQISEADVLIGDAVDGPSLAAAAAAAAHLQQKVAEGSRRETG